MNRNLKISASIAINANAGKVWDVLTNPDKIKIYIGPETLTDWKVGSPVIWQVEHGGLKYQDKGVSFFNFTYASPVRKYKSGKY